MSQQASPTSLNPAVDGTDQAKWLDICRTVNRGLRSSLHCSIATINKDGSPHLAPIGSVRLFESGPQRRGLFFEIFATTQAKNLERDPRFTLLAVDSSLDFWIESMTGGSFQQPPGIRLAGTAGVRRLASEEEIQHFQRFTKPLSHLKGHDMLWGNTKWVRELHFDRVEPLRVGQMTKHLTQGQ